MKKPGVYLIRPPLRWRIKGHLRNLRIRIFGKTKQEIEIEALVELIYKSAIEEMVNGTV